MKTNTVSLCLGENIEFLYIRDHTFSIACIGLYEGSMLENHEIVQYAITKLYLVRKLPLSTKSYNIKDFFCSETVLNKSYNCQKGVKWMADGKITICPRHIYDGASITL